MSEYIPKDKVLELWWYWKFIEAYDQTKEMKGIDLDDYVPREWYDRVCEEMAKRYTADRHKILDDGTLVVSVDDATAVARVLVEDEKKNGDLYYADRPKGEWRVIRKGYNITLVSCSNCGKRFRIPNYNFKSERTRWKCCPICCADMKGDNNEAD